jgi:glycogen phosphorylase
LLIIKNPLKEKEKGSSMHDDVMGYQSEFLASKIKHYLITRMGVTLDEANDDEFYQAFCFTMREEIMINWTATFHTIKKKQARVLYYLCMEYMPGRLLGNNLTNMNATTLVRTVMKKMNRNLVGVMDLEPDPGLGNGGLGRLAACLLDSLATQQYPALGYGLRYQYGIFDQEIWNGKQIERPDNWLTHENPWEFRRDRHPISVFYGGTTLEKFNAKGVPVYGLVDCDEVRAISYDVPIVGYRETPDYNALTLRLWTTKESPRNFALQRFNAGQLDQAAENSSLTDVLYPNDNHEVGKRIRLKQEFLLASASIQDIVLHHLKNYPDLSTLADKVRIQINDTHPALAVVELMRILLEQANYGWNEAWDIVQTCFSYTNHTVLKEALEEWNEHRMGTLLPIQFKIIQELNHVFCEQIRLKFPEDEAKVQRMSIIEGGQVKMANLSIFGSHAVNGVAALHTDILKQSLFKDFYEMYPDKFINVTNGVTQRRWLLHSNPSLAAFITERIGKEWITDFQRMKGLAVFAKERSSQEAFLKIKAENKRALITYFKEKNPLRDASGNIIRHTPTLDEDALFDVHIKRVHEYKRQLLNALHILMIYDELKKDINARSIKRMFIFAGKAAPGYYIAKNIIRLIYCIARKINEDDLISKKLKVVFVENYNASRAEKIIPAADLSEQISTAGLEASGTGNMKLSMNGAMTIGTEDGANVEMHAAVTDKWWPFQFGASSVENDELRRSGSYNPSEIYMHDAAIQRAVNYLKDFSLAETDEEHIALMSLYKELLEPEHSNRADRYFVLRDLPSYYKAQRQVEELYQDPLKWAEYAIHNMAAMGNFSTDVSIDNYARRIWDLEKCPVDEGELNKVREEYSEHDKCRIFPQAAG